MTKSFFSTVLFLAISLSLMSSVPARAEEQQVTPEPPSGASEAAPVEQKGEEKAQDKKAEEKKEEEKPVMTPAQAARDKEAKEIMDAWKPIAEKLRPEDLKHFYFIYSNYNILSTVKIVMGDVGNAVKACSDKNPHMKDEIQKNYKDWTGAINPVLTEADANLNNMVLAQQYTEPGEIKKIFKAVDNVRQNTNEQYEKIPVTSEEACRFMIDKMGETKESLLSYLRGTLVSFGRATPATDPVIPKEEKKPEEKPAEKNEEPPPAAEAAEPPAEETKAQ